ncbi:hypothetical protein QYF36_005850 [Acer negundo]|nr:hypothetical protein QYF36_005850 [Acer negundo]
MRRRRTTSGGSGASGGAAGTMLQFYTDDAPGLKISPNVVLVMSIGFIAFVAILHVMDWMVSLIGMISDVVRQNLTFAKLFIGRA